LEGIRAIKMIIYLYPATILNGTAWGKSDGEPTIRED
jgi:hypothetical protein